jgi:hypothetical protein
MSTQIPVMVSQLSQAAVIQTHKSPQDNSHGSVPSGPSNACPVSDSKQKASPILSVEKASVFSRLQGSGMPLGNVSEARGMPEQAPNSLEEPCGQQLSSANKVKVKTGFVPYRPKLMTGRAGGNGIGGGEGIGEYPSIGSEARSDYGEVGHSMRREQKAHPYDQEGPVDGKPAMGTRYLDR